MKELNVDSIKDFQTCALLYDYRHQQELPETILSRDIVAIKFENTIKSIINFFFYKKQGGFTPSYASLLNRWEKLWFPKDTTAYDITHEQHESFYGNTASLTSKAAAALLSFYNTYAEDDAVPIAIDQQFVIPIDKTVKINGSFDAILAKDGEYFIYKWVFNFRNSHTSLYQMDFSILHEAFKHKFGEKINKARFGYYDIMSVNQDFVEFEVDKEDSKALRYWCSSIEQTEKFVPRRGMTSYCKKCPFDKPCSKWKDWDVVDLSSKGKKL
jgi:hypothetical protein